MSRSRRIPVALVSACACILLGGTALGANTTIDVGNNKTLSPNNGSATVALGDTVTWQWVGPDLDHFIAALPGQLETWDSDPLDAGNDPPLNFTLPHTFSNVGAFSYHCKKHAFMTGTITVTGTAGGLPTASFTITPATGALVGQTVSFDGSASSDPDGPLVAYDWDLDGNGSFETPGATPSRAYGVAGSVSVKLRVTDASANQHTATKTLTISDPPVVPPVVNPFVPPVVVTPPPPAIAKLVFTGAAKQKAADKRGVAGMAKCDLACRITATGWIALPGGKKVTLVKLARALPAGVQTKVVLLVPKASRATVAKLLAKGKVLTASLVLKTADGAKASKTFKLIR